MQSGADDIYSTWDTTRWDFGTGSQYPTLVDFDGDPDTPATWTEFGYQLRDGPGLTLAPGNGQVTLTWTAVDTSHWTTSPVVAYAAYRDGALVTDDDPSTPLTPLPIPA